MPAPTNRRRSPKLDETKVFPLSDVDVDMERVLRSEAPGARQIQEAILRDRDSGRTGMATTMDVAVVSRALAAIRRLVPPWYAFESEGVPRATFYWWDKRGKAKDAPPLYKAFHRAYIRARADGCKYAILRMSATGNSADVWKLLGRLYPDDFGRQVMAGLQEGEPGLDAVPELKSLLDVVMAFAEKQGPGAKEQLQQMLSERLQQAEALKSSGVLNS